MKIDRILKVSLSILLFLLISSLTQAVEIYDTSTYSSGTYGQAVCGDNFCDSSESCSSCSTDCGSCPSAVGSGSPGGGGGFFSRFFADGNVSTHKWLSITAGSTVTMKINKKAISFKQLDITVRNTLNDIEIKVEKLGSNPVKPIETAVYQYLSIEKFNIEDLDIEKVVIKFDIGEKWLEDNKIDKNNIVLKIFKDNEWMDLPTKLVPKNKLMEAISDSISYIAESTVLGYFAVSAKEVSTEIKEKAEEKLAGDVTLACIESWECTNWFECIEGKRTRQCNDLNNCGTETNKPEEIEDCIITEKIPEKRFNLWQIFIMIFTAIITIAVLIYAIKKKFEK